MIYGNAKCPNSGASIEENGYEDFNELYDNNKWNFSIDKNVVADYFLMIAVDSRESLNLEHIWLIKGDEVILTLHSKMKLNERVGFSVMNSSVLLERYKKYEMTDKLGDIKKICDEFKDKNLNGDIND